MNKKKEMAITRVPQATDRQNFSGQELAVSGETIATVLAARAKAEIEARFLMAMHNRRDWDDVRVEMLNECERPGFAGDAMDEDQKWGEAWYARAVSGKKKAEGFSVRFAEMAMRCMHNIDVKTSVIWEDKTKRIISVDVMDFEANIGLPTTIVIEKTVERKFLKDGEIALATRVNSKGEINYIREASDDEVLSKQNSLVSKAARNAIMRLVPGGIQAECRERILAIRHGAVAKDPEGAKRRVVDGFARHNIQPSDLKAYIGHDVGTSSQAEIITLRELYDDINKGRITWSEVMRAVAEERGEAPPAEPTPKPAVENLKENLKRGRPPKQQPPPPAPEPATTPSQPERPDNPPPQEALEPEKFSAVKELKAMAQKLYLAKWRDALGWRMKQAGVSGDIESISENQASILLDVINNEASNGEQ